MNITIHRGAKEIGGSCVEIQNKAGESILLDLGLPLTDEADCETLPKTLKLERKNILGVFISHVHQDHYGLLPLALEQNIPVFLSEPTYQIIREAFFWQPWNKKLNIPENLVNIIIPKKAIDRGQFSITAYEVDHVYGAMAFLVKADNKKVFYSGDFRAHGHAAYKTKNLLKEPAIKNVDALLLEGTTLTDSNSHSNVPEKELIPKFTKYFQDCQGLALVTCSGQNIDRIVTLIKTANALKRKLVLDAYTYYIARSVNNRSINGALNKVLIYLSEKDRQRYAGRKDQELFAKVDWKTKPRVFIKDLKNNPEKYLLLLRHYTIPDLEKHKVNLPEAKFAYSLWDGYFKKKDKQVDLLKAFLKKYHIPLDFIHTSGHADPATLQKLVNWVTPAKLIPIHTEHPERYAKHFNGHKVLPILDGQSAEI